MMMKDYERASGREPTRHISMSDSASRRAVSSRSDLCIATLKQAGRVCPRRQRGKLFAVRFRVAIYLVGVWIEGGGDNFARLCVL
mmetsp:Transcript_7747/g.20084  ORF Transcript_7747/g.20084 Transcript_7747/m.20084 type:complete len:85 (+) Transcript_7747:487-741(+)